MYPGSDSPRPDDKSFFKWKAGSAGLFHYRLSIGKDNNFFSKLRGEIRQELTSLMQTGFIDDTNVIETINEP